MSNAKAASSKNASTSGKSGDDQLVGGGGAHLVGGSGNDTFYTSGAGNRVTAGSGDDVIVHKLDLTGPANDFHGGSGTARIRLKR
jgi:Ca2+-binding RTX toxin-like protein